MGVRFASTLTGKPMNFPMWCSSIGIQFTVIGFIIFQDFGSFDDLCWRNHLMFHGLGCVMLLRIISQSVELWPVFPSQFCTLESRTSLSVSFSIACSTM
ncbi:hypothetical protein NC651_031119 [Populus alba x Populus x berolinensis]|nr:hypothetical protein NC651_031119 [Populus alba x Populus x berolinensis]